MPDEPLIPHPAPVETGPVASVLLDVPLAHLDRPFDYAVPGEMADAARPGVRVAVRFAGRDVPGYVIARSASSAHSGALTPLRRVVSDVPVLTPEVLALSRAVAGRYAGATADVLRLAVPPRHARTESSVLGAPVPEARTLPDPPEPGGPWGAYRGGEALLRRIASGEGPRAVWTALPGEGADAPESAVAQAVRACVAGGRRAVVVVPDGRDVARFSATLEAAGLAPTSLTAEQGPARRYRAFLTALLGRTQVVVGTRSAAFAPLPDLGLVVLWDDGDDLLREPRAPYPHALTVLTLRAEQVGAAALLGGHARSTAAHRLLLDGWARPVEADRAEVRARTPRVVVPTEVDLAREGPAAHARIPSAAWEVAQRGLRSGPVLVQVARAGYVPVTACARCRTRAGCEHCTGPLRITGPGAAPACTWCGRVAAGWTCPECGSRALRATRVGSGRTAEELGRAFAPVPVQVSGAVAAGGVLDVIEPGPRIVVATPGAEPRVAGGYAAALLLDGHLTGGPAGLWSGEEALRRWLGAAALVRPFAAGGRVVLLGSPPPGPAAALVRWDPAGFARRELDERAEVRLPPETTLASIEGEPGPVAAFLGHLPPPLLDDVLGPVPIPAPEASGTGRVRALLRVDRARTGELTRELAVAAAARSARKEAGPVRVQVDPVDLW